MSERMVQLEVEVFFINKTLKIMISFKVLENLSHFITACGDSNAIQTDPSEHTILAHFGTLGRNHRLDTHNFLAGERCIPDDVSSPRRSREDGRGEVKTVELKTNFQQQVIPEWSCYRGNQHK